MRALGIDLCKNARRKVRKNKNFLIYYFPPKAKVLVGIVYLHMWKNRIFIHAFVWFTPLAGKNGTNHARTDFQKNARAACWVDLFCANLRNV